MTRLGKLCFATASSLALLFAVNTHADFDVDDSDSLDFESFHTDKKSAIKIYQDKQAAPQKIYQQPAAKRNDERPSTSVIKTQPALKKIEDGHTGSYEIRERYTLNKSAYTPYSAFYVIESLHKQMAKLCPQGWHKQREWSVAVEEDFYMHYQFSCLQK